MEIIKKSEDFKFRKEGVQYILDMGEITKATERTVELEILNVDPKHIQIVPKCGCTTSSRSNKESSVLFSLSYNNCEPTFSKTVAIHNKNTVTLIKIKGSCKST